MDRRCFLKASVVTATAGWWPLRAVAHDATRQFLFACKASMVKAERPSQRAVMETVQSVGYDGIEWERRLVQDAEELKSLSDELAFPIHGVVNAADEDIVGALQLAKQLGATSILVVAGRVDAKTSYDVNYRRWSGLLKDAAPEAERLGVDILVENVWNNMLFSPLEMARFVDEVESERVGVYFDVGNIVRLGYPDQWIRILGSRVRKLDIKEYSRTLQNKKGLWAGFEAALGEGDVNFPAVVDACEDVGYHGWATAEVGGGGVERLTQVLKSMQGLLTPSR